MLAGLTVCERTAYVQTASSERREPSDGAHIDISYRFFIPLKTCSDYPIYASLNLQGMHAHGLPSPRLTDSLSAAAPAPRDAIIIISEHIERMSLSLQLTGRATAQFAQSAPGT